MKRFWPKNNANKSQLPADLSKYKRQRNLVVKLNQNKKIIFEKISTGIQLDYE